MVRVALLISVLAACNNPEAAKRKRVERALARVERIQSGLSSLRELPFRRAVPREQQTTADFRAFVRREIAREFPRERSVKVSAAWFYLGLLEQPVDLATAGEQTMVSQAAAYYDPRAKKFFVVTTPDDDAQLDAISTHELTHALQDQAFDLEKYMAPKPMLDDDAMYARQFVTEGDATLTMYLYAAIEARPVQDLQMAINGMRSQLEATANMDLATYAASLKAQASNLDLELRDSLKSMDQLPAVLVGPMMDSYNKGVLVAVAAYEHGGWKAVDALFEDPPDSTEQVLHPTTKLFPKREKPTRVSLPSLDGELLYSNVMGELQWRTYFSLYITNPAPIAEGWGGDRYAVVKRNDGSLLAYHATVWDTDFDAKEFVNGYRRSLTKRFPKGDRKHAITIAGLQVFILDGSDDEQLLARLIKDTKFE